MNIQDIPATNQEKPFVEAPEGQSYTQESRQDRPEPVAAMPTEQGARPYTPAPSIPPRQPPA